jgi:hypothetical protein
MAVTSVWRRVFGSVALDPVEAIAALVLQRRNGRFLRVEAAGRVTVTFGPS